LEKDRYKIEALSQQGFSAVEIGATLEPKRDRRTIEREIARGLTSLRNSDWTERVVYLADVGQKKHNEAAANKDRGLKIGHDHLKNFPAPIGEQERITQNQVNNL
jgi:IS30 family transposase